MGKKNIKLYDFLKLFNYKELKMIKHFISFSNFKQKIRYLFFLKLYKKTWCINLKLENVNEKNHHSSYIIMKPVFLFLFF